MRQKKKPKSLNLAAVFSALFALLILTSVLLKIIDVFREARFDGKNHFTLNASSQEGNNSLISFSPQDNTIYILKVDGSSNKSIGRLLNVPVNSSLSTKVEIDKDNVKTEFFKLLIPFNSSRTNLNIIDIFRLWLYVNSVSISSIYQQEIHAESDMLQIKNTGVYSYFIDQKIAEEKIPIEIVNGTDVSGLGNNLAGILSNIGANIVMVSTSENEEKESRIEYVNKESYTLHRISQILGFKRILSDNKKLGDVTIVIGKDALEKIKF